MVVATQKETKVVTGEVRLSYANLFTPRAAEEGQEPKYSCVLLIPKTDTRTIQALKKAIAVAKEQGVDSKWGGKLPANLKITLRDGDDEADLERNPEYEGHMFMSVSSKTKPGIIDRTKMEITDEQEVYSGCYARVSINAFPFNTKGNKGISFGLNNVQKLRDGDFLGGRSSAEADFDDLDDLEDGDGTDLL